MRLLIVLRRPAPSSQRLCRWPLSPAACQPLLALLALALHYRAPHDRRYSGSAAAQGRNIALFLSGPLAALCFIMQATVENQCSQLVQLTSAPVMGKRVKDA